MYIQEKVPLQAYSTMRLGGQAAYLSEVNDHQEIPELVKWAEDRKLPLIMVGGGSNIVWRDEGFEGLILVNKLLGIESYEMDDQTIFITASGGENWDKFVENTTEKGLSGIETLSLIPGTAGAAPVQNIGAYGGQLSDVLSTIEAYDLSARQFVTLRASECAFGYRTSRFKTTDRNRFLITKITVQLSKTPANANSYHSLESYMKANNITEYTPANIRQAIIAIRSEKLPDPALVANCGSFFANPIIDKEYSEQLLQAFPRLASWPTKFMWDLPDGTVKIAAGALLEHEGFKGFHDPETGMATWDKQALVLVNETAKSTADLLKFKQKITSTIHEKFGIVLEQEPELLP
jgi:UDP-N-acetylmuramate dehydrogenase